MSVDASIPAHVNLPASILSMADVPVGWHVGACLGEPGQYARENGDAFPTQNSLLAVDRLRKALGYEIHLVPRIGDQRGFVCIVGRDRRLYEIQPIGAAVHGSIHADWLVAVWNT